MSRTVIQGMRHNRYVLFLTYTDYRFALGGLERYIREEIQLLRNREVSALCLFPFPTRRSKRLHHYLSSYWGVTVDGVLCGFYDETGVSGFIAALAQAGKKPLETQIHHLRNMDMDRVRRFLAEVPVAVKLFLHDYATVCPQFSLLRNGERFCGRAPPSSEKCKGCVSWTPAHNGRIRAVLESAGQRLRVVAPSSAARHVWLGTFPDFEDRVEVIPHLVPVGSRANDYQAKPPGTAVRLAFIGVASRHKGWEVFRHLSARAVAEQWPYEFFHLGWTQQSSPGIQNIPVSIVRDGPDAAVKALKRINADIVLLWALWPETYSYVLQECLMTNAMLVTNPDSGNIADTVATREAGRVFANQAELEEYLGDVPRVRRDVKFYRNKPATLPDRLVPNEAILETLDWAAAPALSVGPGIVCPNRLAGFLYRLKEWKRKAGWT